MRINQSAIRCRDRGGGTRCWQGKKPVEDEESEEEITTSAPPSKQVSEVGRTLTAPGGMELTPEMEAAIRAALEKQAGGGPDPEEFIKTLQPSGTPAAAHAPTWPPWARYVSCRWANAPVSLMRWTDANGRCCAVQRRVRALRIINTESDELHKKFLQARVHS